MRNERNKPKHDMGRVERAQNVQIQIILRMRKHYLGFH